MTQQLTPEQVSRVLSDPVMRRALAARHFDWQRNARPDQVAPDWPWSVWLLLAGRGSGKTRSGAEWVRQKVAQGKKRIALVAATASDVRDVLVEGESGILACFPPHERRKIKWNPSNRRVTFPGGAIATTYSAEEPDRLRGPQHDAAWADELAAWRYVDAWDQLMFGLRSGEHPQCVVTTTPRPTDIVKALVARSKGENPDVAISTASTYANRQNLAASYLQTILGKYEGTTLGRQEIYAEILDDLEGALWKRGLIDQTRIATVPPALSWKRVVVGVDPAVSANATSDETGIVTAALGSDGHAYVLDDNTVRASPLEWAKAAVAAYHRHQANEIVAEVNNGGDLVAHTIHTVDPSIRVRKVTASRGKALRAEPIVALYEQHRVHHFGVFAALEDQMCSWSPEISTKSPDRVDALVWALTELLVNKRDATVTPLLI